MVVVMEFESIFEKYWDKIYRLCMAYLNDQDLAKDLAQDTMIKIWEQLPKFREESNIGTWIYKIASNNCLRQIEKSKRSERVEFPENLITEESNSQLEDNIKLLYQYISELNELDRIIISLELEELPQSEIAIITGLSESNVRVKIHRIKERLSKKFNNGK